MQIEQLRSVPSHIQSLNPEAYPTRGYIWDGRLIAIRDTSTERGAVQCQVLTRALAWRDIPEGVEFSGLCESDGVRP